MPQTDRELLATIYDAFARGDVDTVMASLAEDIEWRVHPPSPVAGKYTGRDAVLDFFPRMMALYDGTLRVEVEAIATADGVGFVKVRESADRPQAGVTYSGVHLWTLGDGRCSRFESFYDGSYFELWAG